MKLLLNNLPSGLKSQRESLAKCLNAMGRVTPVRAIYLFGSHARGEGRLDSDVDLCIVADDAERQLETAARFREAIWDVWPRPSFTLVPITPARLAEKQSKHNHFFDTVLKEGYCLPRKTDSNNPADWLELAQADIEGVELLVQRQINYHLCRSKSAEILEQFLKAELIRLGWFLERTHDLEKLAGELRQFNSDLVASAKPLCLTLAEVYFSDRYPGFDLDDPDWPDLQTKLQHVRKLFETVKARTAGPTP